MFRKESKGKESKERKEGMMKKRKGEEALGGEKRKLSTSKRIMRNLKKKGYGEYDKWRK